MTIDYNIASKSGDFVELQSGTSKSIDYDTYKNKEGSGKYSFDYQYFIKKLFQKYVKDNNLKNKEDYNNSEQTLKLPEENK